MNTKIYAINQLNLERAAKILRDGGVVAFPTETVYGLGANALDGKAVESVFEIKGRPNDNPLIVHVHRDYDIGRLVKNVPEYAKILAEKFLPGPLTMVYQSRGVVCPQVSCGLETVAIRIPSHEGAQQFLKAVDLPVAAPSANLSKHVSPVTAQHVLDDLNGKIEMILDGGACQGGIESTVLDCTGDVPCVLRSGLITREMIESAVGCCDEYVLKDGEKAKSPGMKYKHYSPRCATKLFSYGERIEALRLYRESLANGVKAYIMCDGQTAAELGCENVLNLGADESEIARNLYGMLRKGEEVADLIIAVAPQKQSGVMVGVMNRLKKACG